MKIILTFKISNRTFIANATIISYNSECGEEISLIRKSTSFNRKISKTVFGV